MAAKRIGILTGGGDVPGLNSVIKTVVYRGSEIGCEVIGIRRGWEGLTHVNLMDPIKLTAPDALADVLARHTNVVAVLVGHAHTIATTTFTSSPA